ncbi:hypothetical protein CONPUDRAFT_147705 [Coniophora puteana RWD-64-598 SS2]|uniref:DUF6534 domain-containing protein n=1 Tax=Coniophora puteana (strain RWD-64-598) TaxID=741705 RepID=R7SDT3_CONPW|nr:uncharacterized protein CONPUDRAFT_147705 [Coniophora puteana RWD-64-598 SS2]EIW74326.1 hypothetical protein CONPUDRAFT_147705 [Coniophora puteana RWD-64-598 SS2]
MSSTAVPGPSDMPQPTIPVLPAMDNTLGALLIGCYCAAALHGLVCHQAYRYFQMYPHDGKITKFLVGSVWILETFHTLCIMNICYTYMVSDYFNPEALTYGIWSLRLSIAVSSVITLIAHSFFARRVYILSGRKLLLYIFMETFAVLRTVLSISVSVLSFIAKSYENFRRYEWIMVSSLGSGMIVDCIITSRLCWILWNSRTGFDKTDTLIDRVVAYSINTSLLTSLFTLSAVICAITMPNSFVYIGIFFCLSKLYTNSFLAILNSRRGNSAIHTSEDGSFEVEQQTTSQERRLSRRIPPPLSYRTPYPFDAELSSRGAEEGQSQEALRPVFDIRKHEPSLQEEDIRETKV